jgi:rhodanese-related sulfurtransferase
MQGGDVFMTQIITIGVRELVETANREIETIPVEEALSAYGRDDVVFVDIRDIRELHREGLLPNAFHCPRDMLEFWIDPNSKYHKPIFAADKRFIFSCAGGFRSALAAQTAAQMARQWIRTIVRMCQGSPSGGNSTW